MKMNNNNAYSATELINMFTNMYNNYTYFAKDTIIIRYELEKYTNKADMYYYVLHDIRELRKNGFVRSKLRKQYFDDTCLFGTYFFYKELPSGESIHIDFTVYNY